jgi:hypothetical protein
MLSPLKRWKGMTIRWANEWYGKGDEGEKV